MTKPRILLADNHPQMLASLCNLAAEVGEVVGMVQDRHGMLAEALRLHPDVIIVDLTMPKISGLHAARKLRLDMPESRVIICSLHESQQLIGETFAAGAAGFVRDSRPERTSRQRFMRCARATDL